MQPAGLASSAASRAFTAFIDMAGERPSRAERGTHPTVRSSEVAVGDALSIADAGLERGESAEWREGREGRGARG